jgi:hypothetical protein
MAPKPDDRYASAAELAAALDGCRELCHVRAALPRGRWLTRAAVARPFLFAAVMITLPHLLGSAVNIPYNLIRIVRELKDPQQETAFLLIVLGYNAVVYPFCVCFFFRQWLLVYRVWKKLSHPTGEQVSPAEVDETRRRALRLPVWCVAGSALGWLPGGVLFPLLIDAFSKEQMAGVIYWRFLFSFTVSGLIALTYSVIATEFVVVRVLYPGLWLDARRLRARATEELAREPGRMAMLQFLSVLIPLAGAVLLLGVSPEQLGGGYLGFRWLVTALLAIGAVGLGVAILTAQELRRAVDAMTTHGRE